jgi:hypothetical protein
MRYTKKPVTIEAIQWIATADCWNQIQKMGCTNTEPGEMGERCFYINTLEGKMRADLWDWIIKGINGEFYPCKDEIFKKTYSEGVPDPPASPEPLIKSLKEIQGYLDKNENIEPGSQVHGEIAKVISSFESQASDEGKQAIAFAEWIDGCGYSRIAYERGYGEWTEGNETVAVTTEQLYNQFIITKRI